MRMLSKISMAFGLFATIPCVFAVAHGYDSLVRHDLGAATNLAPFATATTADGGLWLLARGNGDLHQLVRLDTSGNRTAGLFLPTAVDSDNSDRFQIYPLADGGVLELISYPRSQFEAACVRYQFDDALIAGTFRARAGEINLQRLGACPAQ